jgi:hypothetical protein
MAKAKKASSGNPIRIAVLQRGWVAVGRFAKEGEECALTGASIIRRWGTTKGLGEIARGGPTDQTVLDPAEPIRYHPLTAVLHMDCNEEKWAPHVNETK